MEILPTPQPGGTGSQGAGAGLAILAGAAGLVNPAIALGMAAIPEIIKAFQANKQLKEAQALDDSLVRPEMKIQDENIEALNLARALGGAREMPGATIAKEGIESGFANAIGQQIRFGNPDTSKLYESKANAITNVDLQSGQYRDANLQNLMQALNQMGGMKQEVFQFNKVQPYYEGTAAASRLREAGQTNQFDALSSLSGLGIDAATLAKLESYLKTP